MVLMRDAFLYDYDSVEGNLVRLKFRPNSNYNQPIYEARVAHSLAGTILIDPQQKRLAKLSRADLYTEGNSVLGSFGTSTTAAQSRLGVRRSGLPNGRLP